MQATGDGISEVRRHLTDLGLAQCTDAVVNEGFYTSVDALRVATYAGLLECGLQAAHAQIIVTSFGGKVPPEMTRGPGPARSAYLSSLDVPPSCAAVSAELGSPPRSPDELARSRDLACARSPPRPLTAPAPQRAALPRLGIRVRVRVRVRGRG